MGKIASAYTEASDYSSFLFLLASFPRLPATSMECHSKSWFIDAIILHVQRILVMATISQL